MSDGPVMSPYGRVPDPHVWAILSNLIDCHYRMGLMTADELMKRQRELWDKYHPVADQSSDAS